MAVRWCRIRKTLSAGTVRILKSEGPAVSGWSGASAEGGVEMVSRLSAEGTPRLVTAFGPHYGIILTCEVAPYEIMALFFEA
jgi:hypothetical protein